MQKKKIVIIDDHPLLRDAWSIILESTQKYAIAKKLNKSAEIIDTLREKKPDLVILDIGISQLYSFPIIKMIRKYSPGTKIIGVSVQLEKNYARKVLRAGASGFLNIECRAEELLEAVETVLKGKTYLCEQFRNDIQTSSSNDVQNKRKGLTHRELEIVQFVSQGLSSKEIGEKLSIAPRTIDTHRRNILKKLHLRNSTELMQFVHTHGI